MICLLLSWFQFIFSPSPFLYGVEGIHWLTDGSVTVGRVLSGYLRVS